MLEVFRNITEHIPPIRKEYPICRTTAPGFAPVKIFKACIIPNISEEITIAKKAPRRFFLHLCKTTVKIQPLNAISSKKPTASCERAYTAITSGEESIVALPLKKVINGKLFTATAMQGKNKRNVFMPSRGKIMLFDENASINKTHAIPPSALLESTYRFCP